MREYREKRKRQGRVDSTINREISILRTAFIIGRKCTPPKVAVAPYFPLVNEDANARQGFLTDEQYGSLRDALPDYLKPLFVTAYFTGVRLGELLATCHRLPHAHLHARRSAVAWASGYPRSIFGN